MLMIKLPTDAKYASSFDCLIECDYGLSKEAQKAIIDLGYYGVAITKDRIASLEKGERYQAPEFCLTYDGMDGMTETVYDSKESLIQAIKDHFQYWKSEDSFGTDYGYWHVNGCKVSDAGFTLG